MYFYLEWLDKRPTNIELMKDKPETINFQETFRVNYVTQLTNFLLIVLLTTQ